MVPADLAPVASAALVPLDPVVPADLAPVDPAAPVALVVDLVDPVRVVHPVVLPAAQAAVLQRVAAVDRVDPSASRLDVAVVTRRSSSPL